MTVNIVIGIEPYGHHYPIFLPEGFRVVIRDYAIPPWHDESDVHIDESDRPYTETIVDAHTEVNV